MLMMVAALAAFAACTGGSGTGEEAGETTSYEAVGVIVGVKSDGRVLVVDHEKIEGFMDAMQMPFELDDAKLGAGLKKGDTVRFTVSEKAGGWPITKIKKIEK